MQKICYENNGEWLVYNAINKNKTVILTIYKITLNVGDVLTSLWKEFEIIVEYESDDDARGYVNWLVEHGNIESIIKSLSSGERGN